MNYVGSTQPEKDISPLSIPAVVPTPDAGDSSSAIANTEWVQDIVASAPFVPLVALPPAHYNSAGSAGQFAVEQVVSPPVSYFYVCVATNSWLQVSSAGVFSMSF